jgi:hypothetical protein
VVLLFINIGLGVMFMTTVSWETCTCCSNPLWILNDSSPFLDCNGVIRLFIILCFGIVIKQCLDKACVGKLGDLENVHFEH